MDVQRLMVLSAMNVLMDTIRKQKYPLILREHVETRVMYHALHAKI